MFRKAITIASFIFLLCVAAAQAQQIIENQAIPQSKMAGRVIELKEVLKITDEGGEFYFKYPHGLKTRSDGSIFVQDNEQVLRFNGQGKFIRNYFKKGQGPGEMTYAIVVNPAEHALCIQSSGPAKLIWFDDDGKLMKERSIRSSGRMSLNLRAIFGDTYYFSGFEFPKVTSEPQYVENPYPILAMKDGSEELKALQSFPVRAFVIMSSGGGAGMFTIAPFVAVPYQSRYLLLVHTSEYLVKVFDVEANAVVRAFTRKYERVETPPPKSDEKRGGMMIDGKSYSSPPQKYLNDVSKIFVVNDAIWVVTSKRDAKKGVLIDVFDEKDVYTDSFFLNVSPVQFAIFGNVCLTVEKNPDETYAVKKYEILWKN